MKKHIENYDVFKETISQNNVLAMAEQLAMYETRFLSIKIGRYESAYFYANY